MNTNTTVINAVNSITVGDVQQIAEAMLLGCFIGLVAIIVIVGIIGYLIDREFNKK